MVRSGATAGCRVRRAARYAPVRGYFGASSATRLFPAFVLGTTVGPWDSGGWSALERLRRWRTTAAGDGGDYGGGDGGGGGAAAAPAAAEAATTAEAAAAAAGAATRRLDGSVTRCSRRAASAIEPLIDG